MTNKKRSIFLFSSSATRQQKERDEDGERLDDCNDNGKGMHTHSSPSQELRDPDSRHVSSTRRDMIPTGSSKSSQNSSSSSSSTEMGKTCRCPCCVDFNYWCVSEGTGEVTVGLD